MFTTTRTEPSSSFAFELPRFSKSRENKEVVDANMKNQSALGVSDPEDITDDVVPPDSAVEARQRWNSPRINVWRVFSTFFSFFIVGMNDGSYGPLVPRLEEYYNLNYTVVSLVFLSPCAGYSLAAIVNNAIHVKFGQRGIAIAGPTIHFVSYIILAVHPPYPVLVILFMFIGFGNGLLDAAWCAWISDMANANQVSGFLQGCYSLGATIAPLIASLMFSQGGLKWYTFYYIMIGGAAVELVTNTLAFWNQTGKVYEAENPREPNSKTGRTREALKNKVTWVFALFIFGYMGAEVSLGGWIVTFMIKVRSSSSFAAGATTTGFWAGMTVGRVGLSFVTPRLGEFRSVLLYILIALVLELLFWLVPSLIVSAIAVAFLGLVLGPLFGTAMVLTAKLLPKDLHVGSIGFATAIGGSGGAIFPFIVGAVAQNRGVRSLQPIILTLLAVIAGLWLLLPIVGKMESEESQESPDNTKFTSCIPTWGQLNKRSRKFGRAN